MRRWYVGTLLTGIASALVITSVAGQRPLFRDDRSSSTSFDCRRASATVEKLICGDMQLSEDDGNLDFAYSQLLRHSAPSAHPAIRAKQRAWLQQRNDCKDRSCLISLYEVRQTAIWRELNYWNRMLRRSVSHVGQCTNTRIEWIGPRLGNWPPSRNGQPDASGTSVAFANGVSLVSYEIEKAVAASRNSDPVRVCLVSIPQNCPPHDDRGRVYAVRNLRTGGKWTLPDSQHGCGGA